MFEVRLTPQAERAYTHLDLVTRARMDRVFTQFERGHFQQRNVRALRGQYAGSLRYRLGGWRVVFRVDYAIEAITRRGGAYR